MTADMKTRQRIARYCVRLSVPRRGGLRAWRAASDDFDRALAGQESATVVAPRVEAENRRGGDYVRVVVVATVRAADVAEALDLAWQVFRQAAGDDPAGWDMTAAMAEVRPAKPAR
jgi:hypothetical protein